MALISFDPRFNNYIISRQAAEAGLVAIGGDLKVKSLIKAYSNGLFPWFTQGEPTMWWSPDPRTVLIPEKFKVSHSLKQTLKKKKFCITIDKAFADVIHSCMTVTRQGQDGTWITPEVERAYIRFHKAGYAHSFEAWKGDQLAGGLYGVSLGRAFFGESMFHIETDASKVALYTLVQWARKQGFFFIDAQMETSHLLSLGAENIPRREFLAALQTALQWPTLKGKWSMDQDCSDFGSH